MKSLLTTTIIALSMLPGALAEPEAVPANLNAGVDGLESAETVQEIKQGLLFASEWKTFEWKGHQLLVGLSELPTSGESYIDLHGYLFNQRYQEWRRFCTAKTRNVGSAEVGLDEGGEELYLLATANTPMKGKRVFRYSLLLLSDDRAVPPKPARRDPGS